MFHIGNCQNEIRILETFFGFLDLSKNIPVSQQLSLTQVKVATFFLADLIETLKTV